MQITDMLGQYANTLNNSAAAAGTRAPAASSAQNLVSALSELQEGTVFEGSVNSLNGSKVLLGLSNGQTIAARIDASIQLMQGQSMFFQVKSNDGNTIAIKPYADVMSFNPTIQKALNAAGMEMNQATIELVKHMMEEGLPIDRNSLLSMHQTLLQNPHVSMQTAMEMSRLGIPVTEQMAAQFENYQNDRHAIMTQMETVMEELPTVFSRGSGSLQGLLQLNMQLVTILNNSGQGQADVKPPALFQAGGEPLAGENAVPSGTDPAAPMDQAEARAQQTGAAGQGLTAPQTDAADTQARAAASNMPSGEAAAPGAQTASLAPSTEQPTVAQLLGRQQTAELEAQIKAVFPEHEKAHLDTRLAAKDFLDALTNQLQQQPPADKEALLKLFSGKGYHALLRDVMEQQWTVRPEQLKTEDKVHELYERLDRQMGQLEQLARQTGAGHSQLSQAASEVRSNIDFMNQINQAYTYVQIPLKMANQNAHADLYVYTNKRNLQKKEGELSAFLHLDLENLGSTDISIKMLDKNVSTKFYMADDAAYDLIAEHLPELEERLNAMGYNCRITVENREEHVDFVEDFLQQGNPQAAPSKGMVHRYSFDVRA